MLKAAGIFLIFTAAAGMGYSKSLELTRREKELRAFLWLAACLKGAIRCGNASLAEAFREASLRFQGQYREFLLETAKRMEQAKGQSFDEIYRSSVADMLPGQSISREEQELVLSLGQKLGYLDREMQLGQLEEFEEELAFVLERLKRELPQKKKLCRSLGILGGILLGVLFW